MLWRISLLRLAAYIFRNITDMMFSQSKPEPNLLSQQIIIGKPYIFDVYIIKTEAMSLGQFNMTDNVIL